MLRRRHLFLRFTFLTLLASFAAHYRLFAHFGWDEDAMMMSVKPFDLLTRNGRPDLRNPPIEFADLRGIASRRTEQ